MEIKRDSYLEQLKIRKDNGMIKIITGIRRCGKSFLLFVLFKKYLLESGVDSDHIIEIALDGIENEELERELEKALYRVLSKRDADIICNFYGIAGRRAMSVGELADIYNLTDTRINQIRRSAEEKMRKDDETVELLQYLNA